MPIYEYRCAKCGFQKEFLQRLSEAPLTRCPECGKKSLKKMVTAAGFQLKGTGWYATDFKNSGNKSKSAEKGAAGKDTSAKDSGAGESAAKEAPAKDSKTKESSKSESSSAATASPAGH